MKQLILIGLALLAFTSPHSFHAQVRVYEGTLSLPTYEEGPPNSNPPFDEYATTRFNYPYTLRDNLSSNRTMHTYRAVFLENEYLKCSILPDLGGHIYTCTDKINNVPMFYANPSIKEAQIGMRGGWAAVGVEFNFPVSHNWMTVSPIDFASSQNKDGSASVTLSNIDRVYGMQWTVQITLRPATTLLQLHVTLNNRSDVRHRFYWWSNAGIEAWDDTRICYPMRYSAAHGFADVDHWPIDSSGTDLSLLKNHIYGPVSRFTHGSREPFMGIWNPKTNAGVAHYADYAELPAKKIWSWGVDADAMDWRRALSDNNSAYVEVQGGLFRNQETYAFLEPRQTIQFNEYWMPLRDLGGLTRANLFGAVHLDRRGSALQASLNVNQRIPGAEIRLLDGEQIKQSVTADLTPEKTWKQQFNLAETTHHYTFELRNHDGKVLLTQTEGRFDWDPDADIHLGPQKAESIPAPEKRSEDDWLQLGRNDELNGRLLIAAEDYRDALKIFPQSQSLSIASGRLAVNLLHYQDAVSLLTVAQSRDTPNAEIAYYLGLAYDGLHENRHARTSYETAARLPTMRAAASLRVAELDAREGNLKDAAALLHTALHHTPDDLRIAEELVAVQNSIAKSSETNEFAQTWYSRFPTSYFLAEEMGKPQLDHLAAEPVRVLNVATEYVRLGRYESALSVLSRDYPRVSSAQIEPGAVLPQDNPIVGYYKAYCLRMLGRPYATEQTASSHRSILYVFPSGALTYDVLRTAVKDNPKDATAQDLLGTLEFSVGLTQKAKDRWQQAHDLHAALPGLDANRGSAALYIDSNPSQALTAFQEGLTSDSGNEAVYVGMDQSLSLLHRSPAEFIAAMQHFPDKPNMRAKLVYELALHYAESGNYQAAEDLFRNRFFPREEGGTNVRQVWIEIELQRLKALANSEHCDQALLGISQLNHPRPDMAFTQDGMDALLSAARVQYQIADINLTCHRQEVGESVLKKITASTSPEDVVWAEKSARRLPDYKADAWNPRLSAALQQLKTRAQTRSYARYITGLLQLELGDLKQAQETFSNVFLMPDEMLSYHLTRVAEKELTRQSSNTGNKPKHT